MKLDVAVNETVLSNVGATGEFKIRNSAKAFKILSDGLYSNKIRAIIRELSCNALDSHVGAGKKDVPFEVHLPSMLEPWFSVKDFGLGLDGDQVTHIYTTYFESTKTDSNDFIGALGLGSKSPFSYTENFTVTAIKDGVQRIFSAYINDMGIPCIAEMSVSPTTDINGVEIKFSVIDKYEYHRFRDEAQKVFRWFKQRPIVLGAEFEFLDPVYGEKDIAPGVHIAGHSASFAIMGNIAYPLQNVPGADKHFGNLASLLESGLIIEFEIGELDFAASREELSYVPLTMKSLKTKLELLNANLAKHIAEKAELIPHPWDRAIYLQEKYRERIFKSAVAKYVADSKFELFEPSVYLGVREFNITLEELKNQELVIDGFYVRLDATSKITQSHFTKNGKYMAGHQIRLEKNVIFVLNDIKTGCAARAKYHCINTDSVAHSSKVYCLSHPSQDLAVRQLAYDKFLAGLHNPPVVLKASDLMQRPTQTRSSTPHGIMEISVRKDMRVGRPESYTWTPSNEVFNNKTTYYYVNLNNCTPMDADSVAEDIHFMNVKACMDECGITDISNIKIYGVRKNTQGDIKTRSNWAWYEEKLKEETAKISDKQALSLVVSEMLDTYYNRVHTNKDVAKLLPVTSLYRQFCDTYMTIKRASGNIGQLVTLCGKYGKSVKVEEIKKKIEDDKKALYTKYTVLKHLGNAETEEIVSYINMVDTQEKN